MDWEAGHGWGKREGQQICLGRMGRWAWIQKYGADAPTGLLGNSGKAERHPCKPDVSQTWAQGFVTGV